MADTCKSRKELANELGVSNVTFDKLIAPIKGLINPDNKIKRLYLPKEVRVIWEYLGKLQ